MKRLVLLVCLASIGCVGGPGAPRLTDDWASRRSLVSGSSRPVDFTLARFPSGSYSLAQDRGSVVLLDIWATWCEPCGEALPSYDQLLEQFQARGLKVYAISVDADSKPIGPFIEALKLRVPVLHDPGAAVADAVLKVRQLPTSVLLDRNGVARSVHEGLSDDLLQQTIREVESLLAEERP